MKMTGVLEQGWNYILWEGGSPEAGLNISDLEEQEILSFTLPFFPPIYLPYWQQILL